MSAAVFPAFDFDLELPAALIVIDMQPVGVSPGVGLVKSMESSSPGYTDYLVGRVRDEVVPAISRLRRAFHRTEQDVVFMLFSSVVGDGSDVRTSTIRYRSEQRRRATGSSVLTSRADPASDVIAELCPAPGDAVLAKTSMDSFVSTKLHEHLQRRGIRSVVVTGVYTDACVESTARNAAELGYRVFVPSDACCAWQPEFHEQSLANLARYFARVEDAGTVADLLELAATSAATHPTADAAKAPLPKRTDGRMRPAAFSRAAAALDETRLSVQPHSRSANSDSRRPAAERGPDIPPLARTSQPPSPTEMTIPKQRISGVLSPVLTPFDSDLRPDPTRLIRHCRWLLEQEVGLAVFGTNSEANSLSLIEKRTLLDALLEAGLPASRMMPGTGCCALPESIELTRAAVSAGCGGVLMLPPFYYKNVSEEGLYRAFSAVIDAVADERLHLYLYHIPPVSQVPITRGLVARLLDRYPNCVAGMKDSGGDWNNTRSMIEEFGPVGFQVFAGSETFLLATLRAGGAGCITATGNVNPGPILNLYRSWRDADAQERQHQLDATRAAFAKFPMIAAMKAAIAWKSGRRDWLNVRPPLVSLSVSEEEELHERLVNVRFEFPRAEQLA